MIRASNAMGDIGGGNVTSSGWRPQGYTMDGNSQGRDCDKLTRDYRLMSDTKTHSEGSKSYVTQYQHAARGEVLSVGGTSPTGAGLSSRASEVTS